MAIRSRVVVPGDGRHTGALKLVLVKGAIFGLLVCALYLLTARASPTATKTVPIETSDAGDVEVIEGGGSKEGKSKGEKKQGRDDDSDDSEANDSDDDDDTGKEDGSPEKEEDEEADGMDTLMSLLGTAGPLGLGGLGGKTGKKGKKRPASGLEGLPVLEELAGVRDDEPESETANRLFENLSQLPEVQAETTPLGKFKAMMSAARNALGPNEELDQLMEVLNQAPEQKPIEPPKELKEFLSPKPEEDAIPTSFSSDFVKPAPASPKKIQKLYQTKHQKIFDSEEQKCTGLVIVGGGVRGAYGAGAALGIAELYKAFGKKNKWDVVSTGSLNSGAAIGALFTAPGQNSEVDLALHMHDFWASLGSKSVLDCGEKSPDDVDLKALMDWAGEVKQAPETMETKRPPHGCDYLAWERTLKHRLQKAQKSGKRSSRILMLNYNLINSGLVSEDAGDIGRDDTCAKPPARSPLDFSAQPALQELSTQQLFLNRLKGASTISGRFPFVSRTDKFGKKTFYQDAPVLSTNWVDGVVAACRKKFGNKELFKKGKGVMIDVVGSVPLEGDGGSSETDEMVQNFLDSFSGAVSDTFGSRPSKLRQDLKKKFPNLTVRHVIFPREAFPLSADALETHDAANLLAHGRVAGWHAFESAL